MPTMESTSASTNATTAAAHNPFAPLPDELILQVFEHLAAPVFGQYTAPPYKTFAALARTCRYLKDIALSSLYAKYQAPVNQPLLGFLQRLAMEPELRKCLKIVQVFDWASEVPGPSRSSEELKQNIQELKLPDEEIWIQKCDEEPLRMEVAILLAQSTRLVALDLSECYRSYDDDDQVTINEEMPLLAGLILNANTKLSTPLNSNPCFDDLRSLELNMLGSRGSSILHLFHLPALRTLGFTDLIFYDEALAALSAPSPPMRSSTVKSLCFKASDVCSTLLNLMIGSCKRLRDFMYTAAPDHPREWSIQVLSALQVHHKSLMRLGIRPDFPIVDATYERHEKLQLFRSLEFLCVDCAHLIGVPEDVHDTTVNANSSVERHPALQNVLPRTIRRLAIVLGTCALRPTTYHDIILSLICSEDFPNLDEVFIAYYHDPTSATMPMNFPALRSTFRQRGIRFRYDVQCDVEIQEDFDRVAEALASLDRDGVKIARKINPRPEHIGDLAAAVLHRLGLQDDVSEEEYNEDDHVLVEVWDD